MNKDEMERNIFIPDVQQHSAKQYEIRSKFNNIAKQYDQQRRKLIPCFDDFYGVAASIASTTKAAPKILDIGAGTGLFAAFLLEKYPNAQLTLIDISDKMLASAQNRFENQPNIEYIVADYISYKFTQTYDIVISSLSIHHLTDKEKQSLYQKIYDVLDKQGVFVNADQVEGHTPYIDSLYKNDWKDKVEHSGLDKQALHAAYERTKLDKMSPLQNQLDWLRNIGFSEVDCVYKYYNFVVMYGLKI